MSWGHAALELDADADERAIKRAYAKRLRTTRPDDDPEGFQQLHEAYQAALNWAQYQAQWAEDDGDADHVLGGNDDGTRSATPCVAAQTHNEAPVEAVPAELQAHDPVREVISGGVFDTPPARERIPAPAPEPERERQPDPRLVISAPPLQPASPPEPALDVESFVRRVITAACEADPVSLERWLELRPELWSLRDKPRVGHLVLEHLFTHIEPVRMENFDLLGRFFRWDEIGSGLDPYVAGERRMRLHRRWVIQPRNNAWLADFLHRPEARVSPAQASRRMDRLSRPWKPLQALLTASVPGRTEEMRHTLELLGVQDAEQAPPPMQPKQVEFWLALAQRKAINGPKMQLAALRSVFVALCWVALITGFGLLSLWSMQGDPVRTQKLLRLAAQMMGYGALAILLFGTLTPQVVRLVQWQSESEHPRPPSWLLRLLFIPVVAVGALLLIYLADARIAGTLLGWPICALALVRMYARGGFDFSVSPWMFLVAIPVVKLGAVVLLFGEVAVGGALLLWIIDAVTQVPRARAARARAE
jgi:hypothetical protein